MDTIRVVVWGENMHEHRNEKVRAIYPDGMHNAIAAGLRDQGGFSVETATLQDPEHGLTVDRLAATDVLLWWGHMAHDEVADEVVDHIQERVLEGMGLILLHSAHFSKIFKRMLGTSCALKWREAGERERLWICAPGHPIVEGIDSSCIELEETEMYGEPFGIPPPEEQVFISWFEGGEVFRSGNVYRRGNGKLFYFRPGHETYPIYHNPVIQRVLANACRWAAPQGRWKQPLACPNIPADQAPEPIKGDG